MGYVWRIISDCIKYMLIEILFKTLTATNDVIYYEVKWVAGDLTYIIYMKVLNSS